MVKGRKMIAQELKKASGAFVNHPSRENKEAPKADGENPVMPKWFGVNEREKWGEILEDLTRNGVVSSDTRELMIAYCTAYARWREASAMVDKTGLAIEVMDANANVTYKRNGYAQEMAVYRDQMNRLLPEFGLTPASRQKLVSVKPPEEDPYAALLARRAEARSQN